MENQTYSLLFSQVASEEDGSQANPYLITTPALTAPQVVVTFAEECFPRSVAAHNGIRLELG